MNVSRFSIPERTNTLSDHKKGAFSMNVSRFYFNAFHGGEELPTGTFHGRKSSEVSRRKYQIAEYALYCILNDIGTRTPEHGGALGQDPETGKIERFYYDDTGSRSSATYSPDTRAVNNAIRDWEAEGIRFAGMIHSHPGNYGVPSGGDRQYAEEILRAMPETLGGRLFLPIVTVDRSRGTVTINGYEAALTNDKCYIEHVELYVNGSLLNGPINVKDYMRYCVEAGIVSETDSAETECVMVESDSAVDELANAEPAKAEAPGLPSLEALFRRNTSLLPLAELAARTVVVIGCGGARSFCESLVRSAVGRIVLVDGDTVSETNVAT